MTVAPGPNDLTTIASVQAWLNVTGDADVLQALITAASAFIQSYTSRVFAMNNYTEVRDGNGRDSMVLLNRPIASVTSVTIDGVTVPESAGWPRPGYSFNESCLDLLGRVFTPGTGNVTVVYSSGFTSVPADIAQACVELVAFRYKLKDKAGLVSEGGFQQMTSYSQKDMPTSVLTALNLYRRKF